MGRELMIYVLYNDHELYQISLGLFNLNLGISKSRQKNLRRDHSQVMSFLETGDLKVFSQPLVEGRIIQ